MMVAGRVWGGEEGQGPGGKPAVREAAGAVGEGAWRVTKEEDCQMSSKHSKAMSVPLDTGEGSSSV